MSNLDAIASTDGVDVLWVGHFDLSQSMGIPAQFHHPRFLEAMKQVVDAAKRHGKLAGIQPNNAAMRDEWMDMGYNVISWSADIAVYREALTAGIQGVRNHR